MITRQCIPLIVALVVLQLIGLGFGCTPKTVHVQVHCAPQQPPPVEPPDVEYSDAGVTIPRTYYTTLADYAFAAWEKCGDLTTAPPADLEGDT